MGSNIRTPLSNALRGSQITIDGKKYDASDVVNSELDVYTEIMRFLTEGVLDRDTGEILAATDDPNYDGDIIGDAKESGKKPQTAIRRARKMTVDDINKFIEKLNNALENKEGLFYKRVLADKSEAVIKLMFKRLGKLKQEIEELTKKRQGTDRGDGEPTDVRLVDLETFFVNALGGVIDLSQKTIATAAHLIEVTLSEAGGSNIRIIPGGCVEQRTSDAIKDMNGVQQLSYMDLSLRTRAPEGFLRPIINAPPLTRDVRAEDRLTPEEFKSYSESGETGCPEKSSGSVSEQIHSTTCGN
jgi:DNA-binding transcriptional MerR regulator